MIHIKAPNYDEFIIEYRNKQDFYDEGLPNSAVVINHGTHGRAYRAFGGGATFLGDTTLPVRVNNAHSVFNHAADLFGIEVTDWSQRTVTLRLVNGTVQFQRASLKQEVDDLNSTKQPLGTYDFTQAGIHCVTGSWDVTRKLSYQRAKLECILPPWSQLFRTRWWVENQELTGPQGPVSVNTQVDRSVPLPRGFNGLAPVTMQYQFQDDNTLLLFNDPQEGNYSVEVRCQASSSVATFDARTVISFVADELVYPKEYYADVIACVVRERDLNRPVRKRKYLLPEDLWAPHGDDRTHVAKVIDALEHVEADPFDSAPYRQLFRHVTGRAPGEVKVFAAKPVSMQELGIRGTSCSGIGPALSLDNRTIAAELPVKRDAKVP